MKRRTFLKMAGIGSLSIAAGCSPPDADKRLFSLVKAPDDMVTGKATWYAGTCRECPAGCGIIAKNREGRIIKLEGNPLHPINRGALCMRGQAALQAIYHPDRLTGPMQKIAGRWNPISHEDALVLIREKAAEAASKGRNRVKILTETVGDSMMSLMSASLRRWRSNRPIVFEPFAYESLKTANREIFNTAGLPSYRMEDADFLVSFGAEFLETWLSPVEYARKFKSMHALRDGRKSLFFHVAPYQGLTGANADRWLACRPGGETAVALGLIRHALHADRGQALPARVLDKIEQVSAEYTDDRVVRDSGVELSGFRLIAEKMLAAASPLVLGIGTAMKNELQTDMAANLLNLVLDPNLILINFAQHHRVEKAASRAEVLGFFESLKVGDADLVLLNNVNPAFTLPEGSGSQVLGNPSFFTVSFSAFMDETTELADLVIPVRMPLESWDAYDGKTGVTSTLQPAMGRLTDAPHLADVLLDAAFEKNKPSPDARAWLAARLLDQGITGSEEDWLDVIQAGGQFSPPAGSEAGEAAPLPTRTFADLFHGTENPTDPGLAFAALPSLRFFDGRSANRPWLCEIPDPLTKVAWQSPVMAHPDTCATLGVSSGDIVSVQSKWGKVAAPVIVSPDVIPGLLAMHTGQGHDAYGKYARGIGANPVRILPPDVHHVSFGPVMMVEPVTVLPSGRYTALAHTDGSSSQMKRKIALTTTVTALAARESGPPPGLVMNDFPLTLPTPEGYDPKRDIYPPHDHEGYRWGMIVDLDRCIGCGACAVACYAENNVGIVGKEQMLKGREMAWLRIERYRNDENSEQLSFLPMMCQHCDNAPCEAVCPVYAPHHSKEGINNQIYNRCIGTRFCAQNCPYKVRRFNWLTWPRPEPMHLQLNPNVTTRSKGVMEKCSFCIQRIKAAHGRAKNEDRAIRDGEITPACAQTCPTRALTFGSFMDTGSRLRRLAADPRAYQVMGYLNVKPAVIYLKKVVHDI